MNHVSKAIWITWETQIRNRSMASMIGAQLHVVSFKESRLKRYFHCVYNTFATIRKENPDIVFAPNPSIVLNYLLIITKVFYGYKLVSDAHFGGVVAYNDNYYFQKALDFCNRVVDAVIVTNEAHANHVRSIGGNALICEDPLPDIAVHNVGTASIDKSILFVCSFDIDEPYEAAFAAAKLLKMDDYQFFVTGNYSKAGIDSSDYPHVTFLGFLPEEKYYEKLFLSDVVLDLTEHENCLVCGAYEAMAAEKPLVTSDRDCLRKYFSRGTIFTQHDKVSIATAVKTAYREKDYLKEEICKWKTHIVTVENDRRNMIREAVGMDSKTCQA